MNSPTFYSTADLKKWSELVGKKYDPVKNRADKNWIQKNLVPQLEYWSKELKKRFPDYEIDGKKDWLDRDRAHFRHYMWLRFLPPDNVPDLYFTIGIDNDADGSGKPGLVIKIDFQRTKNASLTEQQQEFLELKLDRNVTGPAWHFIDAAKVGNWKNLLDECAAFIQQNQSYYQECLEGVRKFSVGYRISRLTWNSLGWVQPSGREGKSTSKKTHEGKYGYGHEEWLFDTSKMIDGYHYAFLEPIHKQSQAYTNKTYDVGLYTIFSPGSIRYWIGKIDNVEVVNSEEADRIKTIYKKKGWYAEMQKQVDDAGGDTRDFNTWTGGQLFNIRFKAKDMHIEDYQLLDEKHPLYDVTRYTFLHGEKLNSNQDGTDNGFVPRSGLPPLDDSKSGYDRQPKFVQIRKKHKKLQNLLVEKLRSKFGHDNVTWEQHLKHGGQVDVSRKTTKGFIYYEIKTYPSVRVSIREAIGQLLEYAHWNKLSAPIELIIVSDLEIADALQYLTRLREIYKLPLNYQRLEEAGTLHPPVF